eukprot:6468159-Amphidinium_carterae.4
MSTTIGVNLLNTPYYAAAIDEYIQKCPAIIECAPLLAEVTGIVEKVLAEQPHVKYVSQLLSAASSIPKLLVSLRQGAMDQLLLSFMKAVDKIWDLVASSSEKPSLDISQAQAMSQLIHQATILFPDNADLQDRLQIAGSLLEKCGEVSLANTCLNLLAAALSKEAGSEAFTSAIADLQAKLCSTQVSADLLLEGDAVGKWKQLLTKLFNDIGTHCKEKIPFNVVNPLLEVAEAVAKLLKRSALVKALTSGFGLLSAQQDLQTKMAGCPCDELLKLTLAVKRQRLHYEQGLKLDNNDNNEHDNWLQSFLSEKVKGNADLEGKCKQDLLERGKAKLTTSYAALHDIALGKAGHLSWLEGYGGQTWEDIVAHAATTLDLMEGEKLVNLQKEMKEVCMSNTP